MLITEDSNTYRIIGQTEHANQVGRIATQWGNETFGIPEPGSVAIVAAHLHDNGWWEWDLSPDLESGDPVNLLEVPPEQWAQFYTRGIDTATEIDPYAGLLVSMHGAGVRRQRYGTHPSIPSYESQYATFIADQQRLQREILDDLRESDRYGAHIDQDVFRFFTSLHDSGDVGGYDGEPPHVWTHYKLLQAWDRISLYCCLSDLSADETIYPVPSDSETDVELTLTPIDETTVQIDPYPFGTTPLRVPVRGRLIQNVDYESQADLVEAYYTADQQSFSFSFVGE